VIRWPTLNELCEPMKRAAVDSVYSLVVLFHSFSNTNLIP
jgi:hypothetical protein